MNLNKELYKAARNGDIIRVKLMLKLGADIHEYDNFALRWAAYYGHKDVCEVLLKHGADVNANNNQPLRDVVHYEHKDLCKLLLEHGADVDNALKHAKTWYNKSYYKKFENFLMQVKHELKL